MVFTLPVGTWTLKSYFDNIPDSLIESAKIDGAGHWRIMTKIVFPMVVPGMTSIAIYGFVWSWNDLLYSMTLVTDTARDAGLRPRDVPPARRRRTGAI